MVAKRQYKIERCALKEIEHFNKMESNNTSQIFEGKTPIKWFACKDIQTDQLLGCFGLLVLGKTAHLRGWFVEASFRGSGLGSQMVLEAQKVVLNMGMDKMSVKTAQHKIMERLNFHWTGKKYKSFNGREYFKTSDEL